jgi:hypothetical protein
LVKVTSDPFANAGEKVTQKREAKTPLVFGRKAYVAELVDNLVEGQFLKQQVDDLIGKVAMKVHHKRRDAFGNIVGRNLGQKNGLPGAWLAGDSDVADPKTFRQVKKRGDGSLVRDKRRSYLWIACQPYSALAIRFWLKERHFGPRWPVFCRQSSIFLERDGQGALLASTRHPQIIRPVSQLGEPSRKERLRSQPIRKAKTAKMVLARHIRAIMATSF